MIAVPIESFVGDQSLSYRLVLVILERPVGGDVATVLDPGQHTQLIQDPESIGR